MGRQARHCQQRASHFACATHSPTPVLQSAVICARCRNARSRQHLHHAGLHPPRLSVSQQDLRRGAPARQEEDPKNRHDHQKTKSSATLSVPAPAIRISQTEPGAAENSQTIEKRRRAARRNSTPVPPRTTRHQPSKADREKSLLRRHPWCFPGASARGLARLSAETRCRCAMAAGSFLAWAAYNAASQKSPARVWSWHERDCIDAAFFRSRIGNALAARR